MEACFLKFFWQSIANEKITKYFYASVLVFSATPRRQYMFLFNTQLFINGLPVEYRVDLESSTFNFEPIFNPHADLTAPEFSVLYINYQFVFSNNIDKDLKAQAEEILDEFIKGS